MNGLYTNISDFIVVHVPERTINVLVDGVETPMLTKEEWLSVVLYTTLERSVLGGFRRKELAIEDVAAQKSRWLAMQGK